IGSREYYPVSPADYYARPTSPSVVTQGTPSHAYVLLRAATAPPDPVIFLEPQRRYWQKEDAELPAQGEPIGRAVVRRPGSTATLIAYGPMVTTALEAAELAVEDGWDLEVIDVRTLSPLDVDTLAASVTKTGHAVVVHEAPR